MKKILVSLLFMLFLISTTGCVTKADKSAASNVSTMIAELDGNTTYSKEQIDSVNEAYDALTDKQKELIENYSILENATNNLTEYETWAFNVCTDFIQLLRNPDSFQLHSISIKYDENSQYSTDKRLVLFEYSAQNGFGGLNRDTACFAVKDDGKGMAVEWSDGDESQALLFASWLKSNGEEVELDPQRIMKFLGYSES